MLKYGYAINILFDFTNLETKITGHVYKNEAQKIIYHIYAIFNARSGFSFPPHPPPPLIIHFYVWLDIKKVQFSNMAPYLVCFCLLLGCCVMRASSFKQVYSAKGLS
jgi:hypothetical protein